MLSRLLPFSSLSFSASRVASLHEFAFFNRDEGRVTSEVAYGRSEELKAKSRALRQEQVLVVFLEGEAGVGKTTLCERLERLGYSVIHENFVRLCAESPWPSTTVLASLEWMGKLTSRLKSETHSEIKHRDNVLFVDRSLLTPGIYARGSLATELGAICRDMHQTVTQHLPSTSILCTLEPEVLHMRVAGRLALQEGPVGDVRRQLQEEDVQFVEDVRGRYAQLEKAGIFEDKLYMASTKQATAILLDMLGITSSIGEVIARSQQSRK